MYFYFEANCSGYVEKCIIVESIKTKISLPIFYFITMTINKLNYFINIPIF